MLGLSHALGSLALAVKEPETQAHTDDEKNRHARGPLFNAAAQADEIAAQFKDAGFQALFAGERMEKVSVGLQPAPISCLQLAQFLRLVPARINRKFFVDEEVPDFFAALACIKRLVLGVADPAKLWVDSGRLGAVAIADNLEDPFALIDLLTQHRAQVAGFSAK